LNIEHKLAYEQSGEQYRLRWASSYFWVIQRNNLS